jgi:hypothetical protein
MFCWIPNFKFYQGKISNRAVAFILNKFISFLESKPFK